VFLELWKGDRKMEMGRLLTGLYHLCRWITHFAYLNVLWVSFTLLGGGIFGVFPSTVALFTIARKTSLGEEEFPILRTYWETFRKEMFWSNRLGWFITIVGLVWYFDLHFFRKFEGDIYIVLNVIMVVVGLIYIALLLYILPVYVHYDLKFFQYIKQALTIAFLRPANLALLFLGNLGAYYFYIYIPAFIPLFGISLIAYFNMWVAFNCFENINDYARSIKLQKR
jgi:uncharacterized membrane protein YesL